MTKGKWMATSLLAALGVACGGSALEALWTIEGSPLGASTKLIASSDNESVFVVDRLASLSPATIRKITLDGTVLLEHELPEVEYSRHIIRRSGDTAYILRRTLLQDDALWIDLNTGETRPAVNSPLFPTAVEMELRIGKEIEDGTSVVIGQVQFQPEEELTTIIGTLSADGTFWHRVIDGRFDFYQYASVRNGSGYVFRAENTEAYAEESGFKDTIIFLDSNFQETSRVLLENSASLITAVSDVALVRTQHNDTRNAVMQLSPDGSMTLAPEHYQYNNHQKHWGALGFYAFEYYDTAYQDRELCYYRYDQTAQHCFNLFTKEEYPRIEVLADDAIAITEDFSQIGIDSIGVSLENLHEAVQGEFRVTGHHNYGTRHRVFAPNGNKLLDVQPQTFKDIGHFEMCDDNFLGILAPCLITERFRPGTCSVSNQLFVDSHSVMTVSQYCYDRSNQPYQLQLWSNRP